MSPSASLILKSTLLFLLPTFVALLFLPGLTGGFWLDDFGNLPAIFDDLKSGGIYYAISNGQAGPLGRPLSLLSFALQADSWPNPKNFIFINILVHALNAVAVFYLVFLLVKYGPLKERQHAFVVAGVVALIWACSPIQVSSVLYVVQRMTLLSSFFVLLACCTFVFGRLLLRRAKPRAAFFFICVLTPLFGVLGLFAKETAFLLIVYLLCIDYFLDAAGKEKNRFYVVCVRWPLWLVFAGFVLYLFSAVFSREAFEARDFDVQERILSQAVIVWDYFRQILLPRLSQLGLYHENYPISKSLFESISTLLSVVAWLMLVLLFLIAIKRRHYFIVFVLAWFVGGHLLESTTLALELYFEHRNYLPSLAVWFAVVVGAYYLCFRFFSKAKRRLIFGLLLVYVGVLLSQSFYLVKLWGNPVRLAYLYTMERPDSLRAREMMIYLYQVHGEMDSVKTEIARMGSDFPDNLTVRLLQLEYACLYPDLLQYRFEAKLLELAVKDRISIGVVGSISDLFDRLKGDDVCTGYSVQQLIELADLVIQHPKYASNRDNILALLSEMKLYQGDIVAALDDMQSVRKPNYRMSIRIVQLLATMGRKREAIQQLDAIKNSSNFALQVKGHEQYLRELTAELHKLEDEY